MENQRPHAGRTAARLGPGRPGSHRDRWPVQVPHVCIARSPMCERWIASTPGPDWGDLSLVNLLQHRAAWPEGCLPIRSIRWYLRPCLGTVAIVRFTRPAPGPTRVAAILDRIRGQPSGQGRRNRLASKWEQPRGCSAPATERGLGGVGRGGGGAEAVLLRTGQRLLRRLTLRWPQAVGPPEREHPRPGRRSTPRSAGQWGAGSPQL